MTKEQFLEELKRQLKKLPNQELEEVLRDYDEYFMIAQSEGKQDQEVIQSLGSPKQIAKELLATYYIEEMQKTASVQNISRAIWAGLGLGFLNLIFILGPFIGVVATVVSLWFSAIVFVLTPLLVLILVAINIQIFTWFNLFASIALCGIGILLNIGLYYITALLKKWTIQYLKLNVSIVKGERINA